MTDSSEREVAEPVSEWELAVDGRMLCWMAHRKSSECTDLELAALVASLRSVSDALESNHLEEPAADILDREDVSTEVDHA